MSPQFVDFDGDGRLDVVAGTYEGAPYVAVGREGGPARPANIADAQGRRIALGKYWDHDLGQWVTPERGAGDPGFAHGTSAVAFDWDADGDPDLLLGDYDTGRIGLRVNEGTRTAARFTSRSVPLLAGGVPVEVPGKVATIRVADWDADGDPDLVVGSIGEHFEPGKGGGVYLLRNAGRRGAPSFGGLVALVPPGGAKVPAPARPDEGLYPDVADLDGDGDLDLVVGGRSHWDEPQRTLSEAENARRNALRAAIDEAGRVRRAIHDEIEKAVTGTTKPEVRAQRKELTARRMPELTRIAAEVETLRRELDTLTFGPKERYFVWFYRNRAR